MPRSIVIAAETFNQAHAFRTAIAAPEMKIVTKPLDLVGMRGGILLILGGVHGLWGAQIIGASRDLGFEVYEVNRRWI